LVANGAVRNLIRENKSYQINSLIQTGARQKMVTLDLSLVRLVQRGLVNVEDARARAKDPGEFDRLLNADETPAPAIAVRPTVNGTTESTPPPKVAAGAAVRGQPNRPSFKRD
jgi:twitching motility protein PilT